MVIAFNDFKYTHLLPVKYIHQLCVTPAGPNRVRQNISVHYPGGVIYDWTSWYEAADWAYDNVASPSNPGLLDPDGTGYQNAAYKLRTDSIVIGTVTHSTEPYVPAKDLLLPGPHRTYDPQNSPGVYEP